MVALLSNAVKYTRTRQAAVIEVWAEEHPQRWTVLVRDNGVGFEPQYQGKLFSMFQRLHRQEEYEGAGVGLANVRRIVTRHGGTVLADGQPVWGPPSALPCPKSRANRLCRPSRLKKHLLGAVEVRSFAPGIKVWASGDPPGGLRPTIRRV